MVELTEQIWVVREKEEAKMMLTFLAQVKERMVVVLVRIGN